MKNDKQETEWEIIYREIKRVLEPYGKEDAFGEGDYLLVDDNWGNHQQKLEVQNLNIIKPEIVESLQRILVPYPDWEIVIGIDAREQKAGWPPMGLTVRSREIIDGLQRQDLPAEFQALKYKGSRVGTDRD